MRVLPAFVKTHAVPPWLKPLVTPLLYVCETNFDNPSPSETPRARASNNTGVGKPAKKNIDFRPTDDTDRYISKMIEDTHDLD